MLEEKQLLRSKMLKKLSGLNKKDKNKYERKIHQRLVNNSIWKSAKKVGITYSSEMEWDTKAIIETGRAQGKIMAVPKSNPKNHVLTFYHLEDDKHLGIGYAGIWEPLPELCKIIDKNELDLLIVPGIMFDHEGYRIGFGGGYYDRFLIDYEGITLSLAADFQLTEQLPRQTYDLPVHYILTEKDFITP